MQTKRRFLLILLAVVLAPLLAFYLGSINALSTHPINADFTSFYMPARYMLEGKSIYAPVYIRDLGPLPADFHLNRETRHANLNPPFQTLIMAPLARLPYAAAFWAWGLFSLLCLGIAAILVERGTRPPHAPPGPLRPLTFLVLVLAYFPTWISVAIGQITPLIFLLLVLVWVAARKDRAAWAGIALGIALSLKLFVGVLLILFLVRRQWRLLAWTTASVVVCTLATLPCAGAVTYREYLHILGSVTWYAASWNASFMGFFTRLLGGSENPAPLNIPVLAHALAYACSALVVAALVWVAWPPAAPRPADGHDAAPRGPFTSFDLAFSLSIPVMLLASPLGWMYYFPALLLPLAIGWRAVGDLPRPRPYRVALVIGWLLSTVPRLIISAPDVRGPIDWFLWGGVFFYALLVFTFVLHALSNHSTKRLSEKIVTSTILASRTYLFYSRKRKHDRIDGICQP
jgi:hypothetical protein